MMYHAAHNRFVMDFGSLNAPISKKEVLSLLEGEGFQVLDVDMVALARCYIGKSAYRRRAFMREAPLVVDCASLIKWLYANRGIWLPRDLILWLEFGTPVEIDELAAGDLVFTDGYTNRVVENIGSVGHVGMAVDRQTIIHATNRVGIEEAPIDLFLRQRKFCCARRIIREDAVTLSIPPHQEIEISNDVEWILFDAMKSRCKK